VHTWWQVGIALNGALILTREVEFLGNSAEKASTLMDTWPEGTSERMSTGSQEGRRNSEAELHDHRNLFNVRAVRRQRETSSLLMSIPSDKIA
jgi:hypothetical protein